MLIDKGRFIETMVFLTDSLPEDLESVIPATFGESSDLDFLTDLGVPDVSFLVEVAADIDAQQRSEAICLNSPLDFIPDLNDLLSDSEEEAETGSNEQSVDLALHAKAH
jgi:hypothetical protein